MIEYGPVKLAQKYTGPAPAHWGDDLIGLLPKSKTKGELCLEFGCGNGKARPVIEDFGYRWIGVDIAGKAALAYCDGHYLPFPDASFSLVVSIAVFEHLYNPFRAAQEVHRVLKPGGVFMGTTAFLESFHANSYFHMTHLGVQEILKEADLEVLRLWATWHYAEALSHFWVPKQVPLAHKVVAKSNRWAASAFMMARAQGLRFFLKRKGKTDDEIRHRVEREKLTWAGAVGFYARKGESV